MFETIEDHAKKQYPHLARKPNYLLLILAVSALVMSIYRLMSF